MPETIDYDTAPRNKWIKFRESVFAKYFLDEGMHLTVLFPDGTVADGKVEKTMLMCSDKPKEVWGVVVGECWYNLIDVKVDVESIPPEPEPN